jgi:hypothetical protein
VGGIITRDAKGAYHTLGADHGESGHGAEGHGADGHGADGH